MKNKIKQKKIFTLLALTMFFGVILVLAFPTLLEISTPTGTTTNLSVFMDYNISYGNEGIDNITWGWGGTNYSLYDDSLILFCNFDNRSSLGENDTHVIDLSKQSNNGTVTGALFNPTGGKYNGVFEFNGDSDYIDFGDITSDLNYSINHTIAFWFKGVDLDADYQFLVSDDVAIGHKVFDIQVKNSNLKHTGMKSADGGSQDSEFAFTFNNDVWYFYTVEVQRYVGGSIADSIIRQYINGALEDTNALNSGYGFGSTRDFQIASRRKTGTYFNGSIDNLIVFNRSLTAGEIKQLYSTQITNYNNQDWVFQANENLEVSGLNATNSTWDWDYYLCSSNSTGSEICTTERTITYLWTTPKSNITTNFTTSLGNINDYFYGTNDQYNQLADNRDGYLDSDCNGPQETPHNFTRNRALFEDAGMNHIRIWVYDLGLISLAEDSYNATRIRNLMDTAEYADSIGAEVTFVSYGTPTWLANTTVPQWCAESNPFYQSANGSCPPTNHTKLAIIQDYIIENLTQVIDEDKINFIPYNEPWYLFFLDELNTDNITKAVEFAKIYNASYDYVKASHPSVEIGWSIFTTLQTDVMSDYMMANFSNKVDFIGMHYYDGTSYFKNLGWNIDDVIDDVLADCVTFGVSCEKIMFDEWDITIKNTLEGTGNYSMEVAYYYQYLLNNIPANATNLKFKWGEIRSYDTCPGLFSEYPKKFPMFIEADNYLGEDYNVTKAFSASHSAGSTMYQSSSDDSNFLVVSSKNGSDYFITIMNIGSEARNMTINDLPIGIDNLTDQETSVSYSVTGQSTTVGVLDSYEIQYLGSKASDPAPGPGPGPVTEENLCEELLFVFSSYPVLVGLIGTMIFLGIVVSLISGAIKFSGEFNKDVAIVSVVILISIAMLTLIGIFMIQSLCLTF